MKVGIYLDPGGNALGGSEYCAAVLAEAFAREHRVEIVHHKPLLRIESLTETFGTDLRGTTLRYEEPSTVPQSWGVHNPWQRLERAKRFIVEGLSAGKLKPVVAKTFPLEHIVEAHRYLESNQQVGKIVVTV